MGRHPRYSEQQAREAIAESISYTDALRRLGMRPAGGNHATLKRYATDVWRISTDHFDPAWARTRAFRERRPRPLQDVLVRSSSYPRGHLKRRLYAAGLKEAICELCGQGEIWNGCRMSLILDHINGIGDDHRLENLRIVCPNCAATLDTQCGRNRPLAPSRCERCDTEFRPRAGSQRYCSRRCGAGGAARGRPRPALRKVVRPSHAQLRADLAQLSVLAVGRKYGVSDNAVRKWPRIYERGRDAASGRPAR